MCRNSCCLYTNRRAGPEQISCTYCNAPRYTEKGNAFTRFSYLPLIPRLQSMFSCSQMIERMKYRNDFASNHEKIIDVFDGSHYKDLQKRQVYIDNISLEHNFFSNEHDIALAVSTDGFQVWINTYIYLILRTTFLFRYFQFILLAAGCKATLHGQLFLWIIIFLLKFVCILRILSPLVLFPVQMPQNLLTHFFPHWFKNA